MGSLRIIAGMWRSRLIESPAGLATRPLTNRIRQSLFDCLGQRLDGLVVADCCAGSGSFAFEALSRGAKSAHLCENHPAALACIAANAQSLGAESRIVLYRDPLPASCSQLPICDIIFCDPPFPWFREQPERLVALLQAAGSRLSAQGQLLLRGEKGQQLPVSQELTLTDQRCYGRSWVAWLRAGRPEGVGA